MYYSTQRRTTQSHTQDRLHIIDAVKTPLGFFVLLTLVVESVLGGLAISDSENRIKIIYLIVCVILVLAGVVTFLIVKGKIGELVGAAEPLCKLMSFCQ